MSPTLNTKASSNQMSEQGVAAATRAWGSSSGARRGVLGADRRSDRVAETAPQNDQLGASLDSTADAAHLRLPGAVVRPPGLSRRYVPGLAALAGIQFPEIYC